MSNVARATDKTVRQPESVEEVLESKIPGLSQNVAPKPSRFEPSGVSTRNYPWWQEFLPVKVTDPVDNQLAENYLEYIKRSRVNTKRASDAKKKRQEERFRSSGQMR